MSSPPPTTTVVEKAAPKPVVVEQATPKTVVVEQAPAPTAPANPAIVEKLQPVFVEQRRTHHKRWLLPLWLLQLVSLLYLLIRSARLLANDSGRHFESIAPIDRRSGMNFHVDDDNLELWSTCVVALTSLTLLILLIEMLMLAMRKWSPVVHFLTSLLKVKFLTAAIVVTLLFDMHHRMALSVPLLILFIAAIIQLFYASTMLGRYIGDRHIRHADVEHAVYTTAPPPAAAAPKGASQL